MNIKYAVLSLLFVTFIMATKMASEEMEKALIAVDDGQLEDTFEKFEEQNGEQLRRALVKMVNKKNHMSKVVRCLEIAKDPYPEDASNVSRLVHSIVVNISNTTQYDLEAFVNIVASFKLGDVKSLAAIRYEIPSRKDPGGVLELVMEKSPELIIGSLPRWLASHRFNQYFAPNLSRNPIFKYLASHATERVLSQALEIAKSEHFKVDSQVECCDPGVPYPSDLIENLENMLNLVRGREKLLKDSLISWPLVLVDLVESYLGTGNFLDETPNAITE